MDKVLQITEIPYDTGEVKFRYSQYMSDDQTKWIRHGMFHQYFKNGNIASEGEYEHGVEEGLWKNYHENGNKAAEGHYQNGKPVGAWNYWNDDGTPEDTEDF